MPCVLVVCCGLPATGKTTFCRSIANYAASGFETVLRAETPCGSEKAMPSSRKTTTEASAIISSASPLDDHSRVKISHVCYDDYIHEAHRRISCAPLKSGLSLEGEEEDEEKGDQEKQENTCVVDVTNTEDNRDTEKAPQTESSVAGDTDGAKWWHGGRRDAMAVIENLAGGGRTAVATDTRSTFDFVTEGEGWVDGMGEGTLLHVVLADDNMHFRSMRHEVLQVARTCGCGYAQVYFPTDVVAAVERDAMRRSSVTAAVIRKMASQFQTPDPLRFPWELHTMAVEPSAIPQPKALNVLAGRQEATQGGTVVSSVLEGAIAEMSVVTATTMRSFWQMVTAAANDPVPPASVYSRDPCAQVMDREATRASRLHHLDLDLRKAVKRVSGKAADARLTREPLRNVMIACSAARKTTMRHARAMHKEGDAFNCGRAIYSVNNTMKIGDVKNGEGKFEFGGSGGGVIGDGLEFNLAVKTGGDAGTTGDGCAISGEYRTTPPSAIRPPENLSNLVPGEECSRQDVVLESFAHHFRGALACVELDSGVREGLVHAARGLA